MTFGSSSLTKPLLRLGNILLLVKKTSPIMRPHRAFITLATIAVSIRSAEATPIESTSLTTDSSERAVIPWVQLCSGFNLQGCTPEIPITNDCQTGDNCIKSYTCITEIPAVALEHGGVSSLQLGNRGICKFWHGNDCNNLDDHKDEKLNFDTDLVGLPIGWDKKLWPENREEFLLWDTSICNLWDYTKQAHGGTEHWDNKIGSFLCSGGSNRPDQRSKNC
ncbi:hypothetical protein FKW77_002327 [Venturia effusa]|uniref:Uncharacterized protein n=1 Tax=Venturia effusa TaxID=50376 RepID=A0A517L2T8_9PEZI|nr:hypothetical protein FKW77_002327 [Venturia effusa]